MESISHPIAIANRRSIFLEDSARKHLEGRPDVSGTETGDGDPEMIDSGMILPFEQLSLSFLNISYFVNLPKVGLRPDNIPKARDS